MSDDKGRNELTVIEQTMRDRPAEYFRDEGMQERYRSLVDARGSGGAVVPAKSGGRRAEIETIMRENRGAYFKDEALQAEYRALLEGGAAEPAPAEQRQPADRLAEAAAAPAAGQAEVRERLGGDFETDALARAGSKVNAVFGALDPAVAHALESSFDGLPATVRAAIISEAGRPEAGLVKVATPGEIAAFRAVAGAELVAHWGQQAPGKIAVALGAYNRLRGSLSTADLPQFKKWFSGATPREKQLMLWQLGGA